MTTHTQGPWSVDDNHGKRYIEPIYSNEPIAEICKKKGGEYMANARLIAAAPDLLNALEELMDAYSKPDDRICCTGHECGCMGATIRDQAEHHARVTMAKARGQS